MTSKNSKKRVLMFAAGAALAVATKAMANLGSFDPPDGYWFQINAWVDVTNYNAGQYGANAGGGPGPTPIAPDTGLWKLTSQVGDFFPTTAARSAAFAGAPPYPGSVPGTIPAYIIGNHPNGRTGNALAVRNSSPAGTGTMQYDYAMDQYDFGGVTPSTVTSGPVDVKFWYEANDPDTSIVHAQDKFVMSFKDSSGNIGLQWGYARDNGVEWRAGSSGPWNVTAVNADFTQYDGVDVSINLTTQTFGIQYFDTSASSFVTLAPAGTAMGATMSNLTHLGWSMADNVTVGSNGYAGKNFFDDFSFTVPAPEPAGAAIAALAALGIMSRRPSRKTCR